MTAGILLIALSGALASSLVPLINAELLLIGLALATPAAAPLLVVVMAAGQMAGKSALFLTGGRLTRSALLSRPARWRLNGRTGRAGAPLIGVSAFAGLPPFYLVSVVAPALGVRFPTFLVVGLAGRLLRFALLVSLPELVARFPRIGGL